MQARSSLPLGNYASTLIPLQQVCDPLIAVTLLIALNQVYSIPFDTPYVLLAAIAFLLIPIVFSMTGIYSARKGEILIARSFRVLLGWIAVLLVLLSLGYLSKTSSYFSRKALLTWAIAVPVLLYFFRFNLQLLLAWLRGSGFNHRKAVIAGISETGLGLADKLQQSPYLGIQLQGFFEQVDQADRVDRDDGKPQQCSVDQHLGDVKHLPDYVRQHRIDIVYVVLPMKDESTLTRLIQDLQDTTACVYFVPNVLMYTLMQGRTHEINGIPLIAAWTIPFSGMQSMVKRIIDIFFAGLAIALLSPLMIMIAIGVKLSSPGPILFKQRRYGLNGQEILVYKFRSMTVMEDGANITQAQRHDTRITRFGAFLRKTSLDELPQFFNVLQGHMSIVGPRPHAVFHNEQYRKLISGYMLRHKVKPGITGWAQVNGLRGETDTLEKMRKRVEYDLQYLKNWSLGLDLSIIFKTALVFFGSRNAY